MCYNGANRMRDFVDTLPLRLAAVVAAVVGVICLARNVDLWVSVGRVGIAFAIVLLGALGVRRLLLSLLSPARLSGNVSMKDSTPNEPAAAAPPPTATMPTPAAPENHDGA